MTDLDLSLYWSGRGGGSPALWDKVALDGVVMPGIAHIESVGIGRKTDTRSPPGSDGVSYRDKGREPSKFTVVLELRTAAHLRRWTELAPMFDYRSEVVRPVTQRAASTRIKSAQALETERALERAIVAPESTEEQRQEASRTLQANRTQEQVETFRDAHEAQVGGGGVAKELSSSSARPATRRQRRPVSITHPMADMQGIHRVYVNEVMLRSPRSGKGLLRVELQCLEFRPLPATAAPSISASPDSAVFSSSQQVAIGGPSNNVQP